jgi:AraC family transcriptional regulator of adaptative response / DNA-3-methyladenine glycosylase II
LTGRGPKTSSERRTIGYCDQVNENELDWRVCARARLSRDPRFDGKFFIGVRASGVYCRPICPAPTAKEKNCRYYATAAAAAEAGYRPCLRCRPESSPGTPAWHGTSTTVSRALRLIGEHGPEDGGMERLAERLGVGARHLRRLFLKHLGATPNAVAQTRRVHFAKKLIDETNLSMTELALAAGYGSVRRFNAAIRNTYHRTPTQIRAIARRTHALPENHYLFRLRFRPPYDWQGMLGFLAPSATPGVEAVDQAMYRRTISLNGSDGYFEISRDEKQPAVRARIQFGDPRALFFIVERIRALFDLNADWAAIVKGLAADPLLAARLKSHPGLRVPGCWSGFELATRAILGRHADDAATLAGRIARLFGRPFLAGNGLTHLFPEPAILADADLARAGVPAARAENIVALARAIRDGRLSFEGIVDSHAFLVALREITGIDEWTAQYVAMRALGEPDVFPSDNAMLQRRAEAWLPWRAYAAMYLWKDVCESGGDAIAQPDLTPASRRRTA